MNNLEIGIATLNYDETGKVAAASFVSTSKIDLSDELKKELEKVECESDSETLKAQADSILAAFFLKMGQIEDADREKQQIVSEIISCEKYSNGLVKTCSIRYYFKDL